jgi:tripartite-type tricarboxylate transporter receptor subunit TctC
MFPVAGINIVHVPFRSAPDAVTAVIRGDVQFYFAPVNLAKEQSEGGKVNAIAAAAAQRIPDLPKVPTFTEAGLPFVYDSWFGLMAPAGTPKPILEKISKDWAEALKTRNEDKARRAVRDRSELRRQPSTRLSPMRPPRRRSSARASAPAAS